jgi:hypothetical protein
LTNIWAFLFLFGHLLTKFFSMFDHFRPFLTNWTNLWLLLTMVYNNFWPFLTTTEINVSQCRPTLNIYNHFSTKFWVYTTNFWQTLYPQSTIIDLWDHFYQLFWSSFAQLLTTFRPFLTFLEHFWPTELILTVLDRCWPFLNPTDRC